jgi:hypothetical protein
MAQLHDIDSDSCWIGRGESYCGGKSVEWQS